MNILIIGKSGVGKSNFGDMLKNLIFKMDKNCTVIDNDPDREIKSFGNGESVHTIDVIIKNGEVLDMGEDEYKKYDMVIEINGNNFVKWFETINE